MSVDVDTDRRITEVVIALIEDATDAVVLIDSASREIILANVHARSILGLLDSEGAGEVLRKFVRKSDSENEIDGSEPLKEVPGTCIRTEVAVRVHNRDLADGLTIARIQPVSGTPTQQIRADLLNDVDAIIWECEVPSLRFTYISRQAESILGYPLARWYNEPDFWLSILHADDRDEAMEYCESCTRLGLDHEFDYRAITAAGKVIWLHGLE